MIGEELVADIVEVADDGHVHAHLHKPLLDVRNRGRRLVAVDRDAHNLGAGARQRRHLPRGALDIRGVRIGHGLHNHRGAATDGHPPDIDGHRPAAFLRPCFGHIRAPSACHMGSARPAGLRQRGPGPIP